jgi:predicted nucleotidyltransferase
MTQARTVPARYMEALARYRELLETRFGERLRLVRLFGSWARGDADASSDIDVAVVVEELSRDEWRDAINLSVDVEAETAVVLAPFVVSGSRFDHLLSRERRIARDVLEEGRAV